MALEYIPIVNQGMLYINGMEISNNATTPNTKIDVAAGLCRDQTDAFDINLGNYKDLLPNSGITANSSTVLDTGVTGANGLDTGTLAASTVYYIYAIMDFVGSNATAVIASTSGPATGPLMPEGYGVSRHIGYAITDASVHFLKAYIAGNNNVRILKYDAPQATAVTAGNATSYTDVVLTTLVPAVENTPVMIASAFTPGAASRILNLQPVNATGDAVAITGQVTSVIVTSNDEVFARLESGAPKIAYKVSNAGDAAALNVAGFTFFI